MAANDLIAGHIYLIESDAVRNQNWVPTVTNIDLATNYAGQEGVEYCKLEMPRMWRKEFTTGIVVTDAGSGTSFDMRSGMRGYKTMLQGIETSIANAFKVEQFLMHDAHTSGASATFKAYYMIIKIDTTTFAQFMDETNTARDYCPIRVLSGSINWSESEPLNAIIKLDLRSIWS